MGCRVSTTASVFENLVLTLLFGKARCPNEISRISVTIRKDLRVNIFTQDHGENSMNNQDNLNRIVRSDLAVEMKVIISS